MAALGRTRRSRPVVVSALGLGQILGWGSSYYLPAVLAKPIAAETGWALPWVVAGLTIGSLTAGLISARVGRAIQVRGGRPVMMAGAAMLAAGLAGLALSPALPLHLLAWVVIGLGMGCSLYDAAFSTLGTLYRENARSAIAHLTLFGGFASTVCWPLSALFLEWFGWRGACFAYAALHLALTLPAYAFVLPGRPELDSSAPPEPRPRSPNGYAEPERRQRLLFGLMAAAFSLGWGISSVFSVHLLAILQAQGVELAVAVALGALVGPSQVGGRLVETLFGKHYHPIHTLLVSVALVAAGTALLAGGVTIVPLALVSYGAGVGISSIARGTLPLAVFGPRHYALWVGRLAGPALVAGALSPIVGAVLLDRLGPSTTLQILAGAALANVAIAVLLWAAQRRR